MTPPEAGVDHGAAGAVEILPVLGLPEFRPGDDVAAAIAASAPWLRDDDVVVVTSKVLSKSEGRMVAAPWIPRSGIPSAASSSTTRPSASSPARVGR